MSGQTGHNEDGPLSRGAKIVVVILGACALVLMFLSEFGIL